MRAVVFDLDGTLVDSAPDIHQAANRVLAAEGRAALDLDTVRGFIGHGPGVLISRLMAATGLPDDPATHARMMERLAAIYADAVHLTRPFPGVVAALEALAGTGWRIGVCTNKPEAPARALLDHLGLASFFAVVVGGDTLPRRKPDPLPLHHTVAALGASDAAYVGDSEVDAETAAAAGLPFALFTGGYRSRPVAALRHDLAFDAFPALVAWLEGLRGRDAAAGG